MRKCTKIIIGVITFLYLFMLSACEDFVDISTPNFQIVSENVFADDETAIAAVTGIYNQLVNADFSKGFQNSVTVLGGMSADIIEPIKTVHTKYGPFWQNEISIMDTPDALANLKLWSSAYNIIYLANSVLEGLANSSSITEPTRYHLQGQVLFLRAFTYFYLTNLYGDVPLLLTTDYKSNAHSSRNPTAQVWEQIATDLDKAILFLEEVVDYPSEKRTRVNQFTVMALRARVYLYQENWIKAEELSSQVISQTGTYEILNDLDQVFLANSHEAIWQISPVGRVGGRTTFEASIFIRYSIIPGVLVVGDVRLSKDFIEEMEVADKRQIHWVGEEVNKSGEIANYYSYKYKTYYAPEQDIPEYSMVLRFAEQYLIRAEARAMQNKLSEAITDVDKLRQRAGVVLLADTNPGIGKEALLYEIMKERKKELFAEWGHRWMDLKRTRKASEILSPIKPLWQNTDIWYPIPEEERVKNPNLTQNGGY
ncbi:SusD-like protein P25 [Arenibacter antarcticus]|uniref:RagB/SusD family nutrient uptake outer membrane protein n=1 Tax=Arenibacter antarcticus TaxID=2040469 RepID=A0ABW5VGW6_9FLAO|nr:RagB/SusD family nutrient uptake outer membrane protein [Arenibacter sp. H213]MCM4167366.1 RagB/SusD family nutrient uptake outer membrane protein [Arenibacter sp. H213]